LKDVDALKLSLQKEWIRRVFWEKPLDQKSLESLAKTSYDELREKVRKDIAKGLGVPRPFKDGQRVPTEDEKLEGHPIFYAQHATAACCKKCAFYWWGFPREAQYSTEQIDFLTEMCMFFFEARQFTLKK